MATTPLAASWATDAMKATDWQYAGEGGKHALFSFRAAADGEKSPWFIGRLLRLEKTLLAEAPHKEDVTTNNDPADSGSNHLPIHNEDDQKERIKDFRFLRQIVKPQLEQYFDLPDTLPLSWSFLKELREITLNRQPCPIPKSRLKSWTAKDSHERKNKLPLGALLWDYRSNLPEAGSQMQPGSEETPRCCSLSVEIKPKAGYLPVSPLVDPNHTVKYYRSRFVLLQELDRLGYQDQVPRGWRASSSKSHSNHSSNSFSDPKETKGQVPVSTSASVVNSTISTYDPLDLFSMDYERIQRAVTAMWNCPQNNFKLWLSDASSHEMPLLVVADEHYNSGTDLLGMKQQKQRQDTILQRLFSSLGSSSDIPVGKHFAAKDGSSEFQLLISNLLAQILSSEHGLMTQLRQFQQLDVLDGDGAVFVYQRLVELCGGSHREAQRMMDQDLPFMGQTTDAKGGSNNIFSETKIAALQWSPLEFPKECACCPAFVALCQELGRFAVAMQRAQQEAVTRKENIDRMLEEEHETSHSFCILQIASIKSKEACMYLLRNWLLSLGFCDVSFFVTMQVLPIDKMCDRRKSVHQCSFGNTATVIQQRQQNPEEPGVVFLKLPQPLLSPTMTATGSTSSTDPGKSIQTIPIQYEIKVIDCDRKPSKKLESRYAKEKAFQYLDARAVAHSGTE